MSSQSGNATLEFLRRLWPEGYTYCVAVKGPQGRLRQRFFTSIDDAAAFSLQQRDEDVYHACAVFKEAGSRKSHNAAAVQAFWLDVDVGPGKPYADARTAAAAILAFAQTLSWPMPTLVHSGGGWHAYWFLNAPIAPEAWTLCAAALRDLCERHGLHADHGITIDVARILRPPGTLNYKRGSPEPVTVKHWGEPTRLAALAPALRSTAPAPVPQVDNSRFEAKTPIKEAPAYGRPIAENCRQLAAFRDTGGRLTEPLWYAGLGVLAKCEDGSELAHAWSKGDERYVFEDTERKYAQAGQLSGPTTCARFQALNAEGCAGCPHAGKITSPLQLGRGAETPPQITVVDKLECPHPPSPFKRSTTGALTLNKVNENGENETVVVYKAPIYLETIREHELTGTTSLILRHWLRHEGWLEAVVPWVDRSQRAVVNAMAAQKINIPRARERDMLWFLENSIDDFQMRRKTEMEYAQFGWRDDFQHFVLGNELYTPGTLHPTLIGTAGELSARAAQMKTYGTYDGWRAAAQPLFVHEQQGLMVVAGFASVLMRFVQELTGVIIAAVSPEPRLGKTMGLVAARSIWGQDSSIDIATNDTSNSRFKMLSILNGLPATWDDMRKSNDPEIIKQFVLSFSQGRDKNRLDRGGQLRANVSGWSSILLATSNVSIAELVGHDGETAQQARILEYRFLPMAGMKFSDGQQYERQLRQNRGHAGRRFITALMLPGMLAWVQAALPQYVKEYEDALKTGNASFYASVLGCIKAASIILNRTGMLEFSTDRLMDFAVKCATGMTELMEDTQAIPAEILTRFINEHIGANTLVVQDAWQPRTEATMRVVPRGKLVVRHELTPQRIFLDKIAFKEWCRDKNIMFRNLVSQLNGGVIVGDGRRINLGAGTQFAGGGQTTCIEVDGGHPALGNLRQVENVPEARVAAFKRVEPS